LKIGIAKKIEGILFDMGGTLRFTIKKGNAEKEDAIHQIIELIGEDTPVDKFTKLLNVRREAYKNWAEQTLIELNEEELWTQWMLPDRPAELIHPIAIQLNEMYRNALGTYTVFPETYAVVIELYRRGYQLGLVSNTTSSVEVPNILIDLRLTGCFDTVILSTVVGKRKPDPNILLSAAERMGISPEKCAYIGNQPKKDVAAARKAGYSMAVIIRDPDKQGDIYADDPLLAPDQVIGNLKDLLRIFPIRKPALPELQYNASLSTMWALGKFPSLTDFFEFTRRAGFACVELNHRVNSTMLEGINLSNYSFSSIHEPCPADISVETLVKQDWQVSSLDEGNRKEGVKAIQRSINLAHDLGAPIIIVHVGNIPLNIEFEKKLQKLFAAGEQESDEYREIQAQMIKARADLAASGLESVKKSLLELLAYASQFGIRLGLENRSHFREYPSPDELGILLGLGTPDQLGFIYDVGHGQQLSRMGFYPYDEWLKRFSSRILGIHLHDVCGLNDHFAAGLGNVDFNNISSYLPENALRTCEFEVMNTPEQVKSGLKFLYEQGCIKAI
jgi:putative hydrolase of the HAD superfamily